MLDSMVKLGYNRLSYNMGGTYGESRQKYFSNCKTYRR